MVFSPDNRVAAVFVVAALAIIGVTSFAASQAPSLPAHPASPITPVAVLTQNIADSTRNVAQLRRGQSLVVAGDCMSCHLREGGEPLAGGLGLKTPFGVIYSSNITSDRRTGIGRWTNDQFYRAMHDGIGAHGENLYPAFPYPWFRRVSRADDDALLAFLKTTPAVDYTPPKNALPFPLNIRFMVKGWNLLFLRSHDFRPNSGQSASWNRGAYLVTGLGHCAGCHTPKNLLAAQKSNRDLYGGATENWIAPDLTGNARTGLGRWTLGDIMEYLGTGRGARAGAGGPMAEVVTYSTALMSDQDRASIALYLKTLPASPNPATAPPDGAAMARGGAIYSDVCASCHLENGIGQPRLFPPLGQNAMLQQSDPTGLVHTILAGSRIGISPSRPSPLAMPSFAWKLSNSEIADISTYIRNSWGNRAEAVKASKVSDIRRRLNLETVRLTANSGDRS